MSDKSSKRKRVSKREQLENMKKAKKEADQQIKELQAKLAETQQSMQTTSSSPLTAQGSAIVDVQNPQASQASTSNDEGESDEEVDARFNRADKDVYDACYKRMWWELGLFMHAFPPPKVEMDHMIKIWKEARDKLDPAGHSVDPAHLYKKKYKYIAARLTKSMGSNRATAKRQVRYFVDRHFKLYPASNKPEDLQKVKDRVNYLVDVEGDVKRRFALNNPD
ncbi:hypothetical protein BJ508DRAFT_316293, partial [Ascobolus immersus RN42]